MIFALVNILCIFMLVTQFVWDVQTENQKASLRGVGKMFDGDSVVTPIRLYPYPGDKDDDGDDGDSVETDENEHAENS